MSLENSGTSGGSGGDVNVDGRVVVVSRMFPTSEDVEFSEVSVVMSEPTPEAVVADEVVVTVAVAVVAAAVSVSRMTSITTPWLGGL